MVRKFTELSYTKSVKDTQERFNSRESNQHLSEDPMENSQLGEFERKFISQRDSFYMATTGETGWPYIQHRGGPKGFVKTFDNNTICFPDFRGNRQYISAGNIAENGRTCLMFMDYVNRRRLKVWAIAKSFTVDEAPERSFELTLPDYRARVERFFELQVQAFDWNCPQHIYRV